MLGSFRKKVSTCSLTANTFRTESESTTVQLLLCFFRLLFVAETIITTRTQDEPKMVLAASHTAAIGDGRISPFVVQAGPKTSGDVRDNERKVL